MRITSFVLSLLLVSSVALAQQQGSGQRPGAAGAAPARITLSADHQVSWARNKGFVNDTAKNLPEDMSYKPGYNPRTFGEVWGHMANERFKFCAAARGVANPNTVNLQQTIKTRADALKAIACGAQAVQVVSVLLREGVGRLRDLRHDLETWMDRRRVPSLEIYRGSLSLLRCPDPKAWERIQYMRILQTRTYEEAKGL